MTCRHWRELDDDSNSIYEYCKGARKRCTCSGEKNQCDYPTFFNADPGILEDKRREQAIQRGIAMVEPFLRRA